MNPVIDARGLACPQPVVLTAKALADADHVTPVVDNAAAVENVTRLARSRGFVPALGVAPPGFAVEPGLRGEKLTVCLRLATGGGPFCDLCATGSGAVTLRGVPALLSGASRCIVLFSR